MDTPQLAQRINGAWPLQQPVATTAQLLEAGVGMAALAQALRAGLLFRLRKGAYVQAANWSSLKPWDQDKVRLYAHVLSVRSDPVYSHFSAASLHGLFVWNCGPDVHLSCTSSASGTSGAKDVVIHREALEPSDVQEVLLRNGRRVRATSLERTVLDCARCGPFAQAVVIGDHALRVGARMETLQALVGGMGGRRGVRKARRVLAALDPRSESGGETRTRLIIAGMQIDQPELQVEIWAGEKLYRPDFVWRKQKLIVEFDGDVKYFAYRRTGDVILDERKREKRLMELGWRFVRLEWKDLAHPQEVQRRIMAAYTAAALANAA